LIVKVFSVVLAVVILIALSGYASAAAGTREDPVPMVTTVDLGDGWLIAVMSVIPDATSIVLRENQFNDPPKEGNQFFLARVRAKYTGQGSATFGGSYRFRAVGPSSVGYSTFENSPGVIPDPIPGSEVFSGGIIEGNVGWEIKSSDADSLVMYDSPMSFGSEGNRVYMALYVGVSSSEKPGDAAARNIKSLSLFKELVDEGYNLSKQGKYDEAVKALDEAIELCPEIALPENSSEPELLCAYPWFSKGTTLDLMGKYDEAIKAYDEAIRLDPNYAFAWYFKGTVLGIQGKYVDAIKCFDEAIRLDPKRTEAWIDKGTALYGQGKYDEAIKAYDEAIRLDPQDAVAWSNKGTVLGIQGKYNEYHQGFR
jgi:tetratricopeptide (TPR) repeat protein